MHKYDRVTEGFTHKFSIFIPAGMYANSPSIYGWKWKHRLNKVSRQGQLN